MIRMRLPHFSQAGEVECCIAESSLDIDRWISANLPYRFDDEHEDNVVGFDCEWRPQNRPGQSHQISLVQLARPDSVLLVQLHRQIRQKSPFPKALSALISNKSVVKTGVGVLDDLWRVGNDHGFDVRDVAFLDLAAASRRHETALDSEARGRIIDGDLEEELPERSRRFGLAVLASKYLGSRPTKPKHVQLSNWERVSLTEDQILYAAYDALMGIEVYHRMRQEGALKVEAIEHIRRAAPTYWQISSARPVHRTHIRSLWLASNESSHLLQLAGEHLVREDRRWFHLLDRSNGICEYTTADSHDKEDTAIQNMMGPVSWSKATLALLSRFGVTPKYVLAPNRGPGPDEGKGDKEPWMIMVICDGKVLGQGNGSSKAQAREVACQVVLRELMQLLETQLLSGTVTELFHAYAGKAPVPASFAQYLKSKPQMRV
jgi:ribonuclease D